MKPYIRAFLILILFNSCSMKNQLCKTENGYEIIGFGAMPINIDDRIEKEGCKCLSESLLWNPNPKPFNSEQLQEIRKELPNWAVKNIPNFMEKDKKELSKELASMPDTELLQKLKYRYSFFWKYSAETYVYTIKIKNKYVYCVNYINLYEAYNIPDFISEKYKVNYPILENEDWARNEFGDAGIVSLKKKEDDNEIYKTYKGKNHTKTEWDIFEQEQFEAYTKKHNFPIARKDDKGKLPPSRFLLED